MKKTALTVLKWVTRVALLLALIAVAFGKGCPAHAEEFPAAAVPIVVGAPYVSAEDQLGGDGTVEGTTGVEVGPQSEGAQRRARRLADVRERLGRVRPVSPPNELGLSFQMAGRWSEAAAPSARRF